jgi:cyclic-di-GMP phosphodiesterase TipF (flagellum assembly factor)
MIRISAIFIAVCMVLIAASCGAVLYLSFGFSGAEAAVTGVAVLTGLALYNNVSTRLRDRTDFSRQIADLSRGTADLARQVGEFGRRLVAIERKTDGLGDHMIQVATPLNQELSELGSLVKQLAESVAAHDTALIRAAAVSNDLLVVEPQPAAAAPARAPAAPRLQDTPAPIVAAATPSVEVPPPAAPQSDIIAKGRFQGMRLAEVEALVKEAVDAERLDIHLQPIVVLPQRKVRFYEALVRLKTTAGDIVPAAEFLPHAERAGLMPQIDNLMLFRCVRVVRKLMAKKGELGLFCNVSTETLRNRDVFAQYSEFLEANRAVASAMVLEFSQKSFRAMGAVELEALTVLASRGFRFSIDNVTDLGFDVRDAADKHVRFVKIPAALMLSAGDLTQIHPADTAALLSRYGVDLVIDKIESEALVVELLDFDVKFGQGNLFSPPRPVRPEVIQAIADPMVAGPPVPVPAPVAPPPQVPPPRLSGLAQLARGAVSRS